MLNRSLKSKIIFIMTTWNINKTSIFFYQLLKVR